MPDDAGTALLDALHDHNPWWSGDVDTTDLPVRHKSDFYHLARPDEASSQFQDQPILGLVGRRGVGKTTLLKQFITHQLQAEDNAPERFLYLPFDADPLYQLRSDDQLRQVLRYYDARILGRLEDPDPHFLILDDVHTVEHPTKPEIDGWATPINDRLADGPNGRHVVVTATAGVQLRREFDRVDMPGTAYDIQPILPEKFRDYLYTLYPALETDDHRVSPTSLREGPNSLPHALDTGEVDGFVEELRDKHERIVDWTTRIQSQVVHYLAMGGVLAYDRDGAVDAATDLPRGTYTDLWEDVRTALYQDVPGFETIQTIADLERLCALAARRPAGEPIPFKRLVDLLDVDRRTVRDSYIPTLSTLYLLTSSVEYDNQRPRAVRLYLRDTGLATALTGSDPAAVVNQFDREADLAHLAAFDHTVRLAYNTRALHGDRSIPEVWFWEGPEGTVDFVFEIDDTPVPVGLAYKPGAVDGVTEAITAFRRTFDTPVGILLTGDTVRPESAPPIEYDDDRGIVTMPYWFYLLVC